MTSRLEHFWQVARFAVVGLSATVVHVLIFSVLVERFGVQPLIANVLAFAVAVCVSFFAHSRWTFAQPGPLGGQAGRGRLELAKFMATALTGLLANSLIVYATMTLFGLPSIYPSVMMVTVTPALLYLMNRFWVFSKRFDGPARRGDDESAPLPSRRAPAPPLLLASIAILALSILVLFPLFWPGAYGRSGDARFHLIWQNALVPAIAGGDLYPRWLATLRDGFGSPAFFIYPPVSHFAAAAFALLPPLAAATEARLVLATLASFVVAGIGMVVWMRERGLEKGALAAGAFYTVVPYHLYVDVYHRAAFAESFAFAWLPWIFYGIGRLSRHRASGSAVIAIFTALLLATHLLTALSIMPAAGLYALLLYANRRDWRLLLLAGLSVGCAVLLAGGYLGTALTHFEFVRSGSMFGERSLSWRWLIGGSDWPDRKILKVIVAVWAMQTLVIGGSLWMVAKAMPRPGPLFWFCLAAGGAATFMTTLLSAPIWWLDTPLNRMQFPWRLLTLHALAGSAAVGLAFEHAGRRGALAALLSATLAFNLGLLAYRQAAVPPRTLDPSKWAEYDASEYRLGDLKALNKEFPDRAPAVLAGGRGSVALESWKPRHLALRVSVDGPATLLVRQLNYSGWRYRIDGAGEGSTVGENGQDAVRIPLKNAGAYTVSLDLVPTRGETLGWWASLAGVVLFALMQAGLAAAGRLAGRPRPQVPTRASAPPTRR